MMKTLYPYSVTCRFCDDQISSYHKYRGTSCECGKTGIDGDQVTSYDVATGEPVDFKVRRSGGSQTTFEKRSQS